MGESLHLFSAGERSARFRPHVRTRACGAGGAGPPRTDVHGLQGRRVPRRQLPVEVSGLDVRRGRAAEVVVGVEVHKDAPSLGRHKARERRAEDAVMVLVHLEHRRAPAAGGAAGAGRGGGGRMCQGRSVGGSGRGGLSGGGRGRSLPLGGAGLVGLWGRVARRGDPLIIHRLLRRRRSPVNGEPAQPPVSSPLPAAME